ncbi:MAG: hypothetical protein P8J29_08320, partial [Rhodospirillales bacterium]|nr:hypothetical protein [Rhodospirillales bacterium]
LCPVFALVTAYRSERKSLNSPPGRAIGSNGRQYLNNDSDNPQFSIWLSFLGAHACWIQPLKLWSGIFLLETGYV